MQSAKFKIQKIMKKLVFTKGNLFFSLYSLLIIIVLILLVSSFTACSPQRRLQRLVAHHPELLAADTLLVHDTLVMAAIVADTSIPLTRLTDTVVIARDKLEIKLVKIRDTIHVTGTCKADTIVRELRVPVEKIKLVKAEGGWLSKVLWIVIGLVVVALVVKIGTRDTVRKT